MRMMVAGMLIMGCTALQGENPPNILLITSDDLNTRIGPYMDLDKHTPHLDQLAEEGVRFTRAYCQFPLCGPSRASFMSGLYPETNGVLVNSDEPGSYKLETPALADHPSMAGFFREHGYFTARVSKIFHMGVPGGIERGEPGGDDPTSWDYAYNVMAPETQSQGDLELLSPKNLHYGSNFARMVLEDGTEIGQADYMATNQAIAILENRLGEVAEGARNKTKMKPDAPFFLAVGYVRPHVPFIAPERCFLPYPDQEMELPPGIYDEDVPAPAMNRQNHKIWGMDELQQRQTIAGYMASVRFMDEQVGRLLAALERLGGREETIVIFVSDHGYNLGEHDCWSKVSLWEGSVRVPLIISSPGIEKTRGTTNASIVELIDLYPTLTELCGFQEQTPGILQGESMVPFLEDNQRVDEDATAYMVSYKGRHGAIRTDRWKYHRWGGEVKADNEELYDHRNDPEEHHNLAYDKKYRDVLEMMRETFDAAREGAKKQKQSIEAAKL